MTTAHLGLPLIAAAQAQKHITHNEGMMMLDALLPGVVVSATTFAAPSAPVVGEAYIVPTGGTFGAVPAGQIALRQGGEWVAVPGRFGMAVAVLDEGRGRIFAGSRGWVPGDTLGRLGGTLGLRVVDFDQVLTGGATVSIANAIPARVIVLGVSSRVIADVTGPASFRIGDSSDPARFGASLDVVAGSNDIGAVHPFASAAVGPLIVSAQDGTTAFTGGRVRLSLHLIVPGSAV